MRQISYLGSISIKNLFDLNNKPLAIRKNYLSYLLKTLARGLLKFAKKLFVLFACMQNYQRRIHPKMLLTRPPNVLI